MRRYILVTFGVMALASDIPFNPNRSTLALTLIYDAAVSSLAY